METLITIGTIALAIPASLMLMSILNKKEEVKPFKSMAEMLKGTPEEDARIKKTVDENLAYIHSNEGKRAFASKREFEKVTSYYNRLDMGMKV